MKNLPDGTVTLLFTDIEGSTQLLHHLGEAYPAALARHREIVRAAVEQHGGVEADTQGDAFFVVFAGAHHALAAVAQAQTALHHEVWPLRAALRVRMGLHTGEPARTAEGYAGADLHRCARIAACGHGGQVLLSQTTHALVQDDAPEGAGWRDLGSHRLKDLPALKRSGSFACPACRTTFPRSKASTTAHTTYHCSRRRCWGESVKWLKPVPCCAVTTCIC